MVKSRLSLREDGWKRVAGGFMSFTGFSKESLKYARQNFASLLLGPVVAGIAALSFSLAGLSIFISFGIPLGFAIQVLLVAQIFEEVILRGIYLRVLVGFLGKNDLSALFGVVISSLVFGYIHAGLMDVKVLGGIVLACIYLYKWRGNLVACVLAHFSVNLFIMFFATGIA
jgi:membrane protease YdiL (CAAX protease family)